MGSKLRYVTADRLSAKGIGLDGAALMVEGKEQSVGELDGIILDPAEGRVRYLVVEMRGHEKRVVPFEATRLKTMGDGPRMLIAADEKTWGTFQASAYAQNDAESFRAA